MGKASRAQKPSAERGYSLTRYLVASLGLFALLSSGAPASASYNDLVARFHVIRTGTVWPVAGTTFDAIVSTFGPRIKASTGTYDWHRGIDIDAVEGTPALAAVGGQLWKVTQYADGGTTVILRHTFRSPVEYGGQTLRYYYTLYMHLSSVAPELVTAAAAGQRPTVAAGAVIGAVGRTGSAISDHLHFELRVGTWCSLEYQIANPSSSCAGFGFDPHMHPMLLFAPLEREMSLSPSTPPTATTDGQIRFVPADDQPLLEQVKFTVVDRMTKTVVASHVLSLNQRIGYDATTTEALDTVDRTKPYLSPQPYDRSADRFATDIVIPAVFVGNFSGSRYRSTLTVRDIWGTTISVTW